MDDLATCFEQLRPRLLRVAYGTLDVVRNPDKLRHVRLLEQ